MARAKTGDTVRIHDSGRLDDGTEFGSSAGRDPLRFTIGEGTVIPTLDEAVRTVDRSMIPENVDLSAGGHVQATAPNGQQLILAVVEVTEVSVTLDANRPLAGQNLTFDIELVEIVGAG